VSARKQVPAAPAACNRVHKCLPHKRKCFVPAGNQVPASVVSIPEPRLLNVRATAAYLGATVWFVRSLAWSRAIPFVVFGKRILFDKQDLDRYIDSQKETVNGKRN
jgi:excisionase family DNA binding protein